MASSSNWMAEAASAPLAAPLKPDWIIALAPRENPGTSGFRDLSPFAPAQQEAEADPGASPPQEPPLPEPEIASAPEEDPEVQGYRRGFGEGHAQAKREGEEALAAERAQFRELRLAFRALDAAALDGLAQDLKATVLDLCAPVLGEFAADEAALAARCQAAARTLGAGPEDLTLRLHPETRAKLDEAALPGWSFVDDASLAPGALSVSGADGTVRDGPEDWARAITEALGA